MTTIAFDGKILAVDRGIGHMGQSVIVSVESKIVAGRDRVAAVCGSMTDGLALAAWWVHGGGAVPADIDSGTCLIGFERGNKHAVYVSGVGRQIKMPTPTAEAVGGPVAMGAMLAGANAVEAVLIACQVDKDTLGPVDYVLVDANPWIIRQASGSATRDTLPVRQQGDVPHEVRLGNGSANGGSAPRPPHEGQL